MSEISEAEKRRILRERRQQKFSNGGASSRLNKITGQAESSFLSTESPIDSRSSTPSAAVPANNDQSTKQMEELLASISNSAASSRENKSKQESGMNPQMDLFAQLAKMQQNDAGQSTPDTPDIFAQLLKSVQQQENATTPAPPSADATMIDTHNKKVNKLKAYAILIKWLLLTPYLFYIAKPKGSPFGSTILNLVLERSNFFTVFTSFEIVAISIYYQLVLSAEKSHKVNTLQSNSRILQIVSMVPEGIVPIRDLRGKAALALQYWDVLSMYLTDICFALVLFGVLQYYHSV